MSNELQRYAKGELRAGFRDARVAREAKEIRDEVRLAGHRAEGAAALAVHLMEGVIEVDKQRRNLAEGDPLTSVILADIQTTAIRQMQAIQRGLYSNWGL